MTSARILQAGAVLGAAAVLLGAFAAHGLQHHLSSERIAWFETGVRYHMAHALALVLTGLMARTGSTPKVAAAAFCVGILLFSGSLYALALTEMRAFAWLTPVGGVAFVVGWLALLRHCRPAGPPAGR